MARLESRLKKLEGKTIGNKIMCLISPSDQKIKRLIAQHGPGSLRLFIANIKRKEAHHGEN